MKMRMVRFQERYFLPILILLLFSLLSWTAVHSDEALNIKEEKGAILKIDSALFDLQKRHLLPGERRLQILCPTAGSPDGWSRQVTVLIQPKAGETKESIDIEALKAYGGEVLKSGHSVVKAKVPIALLDFIADHVKASIL